MHKNLMWTRSGVVWGMWRLKPIPYGHRNRRDKDTIRKIHTSLFRELSGDALILGLCASIDPASVVEKMIKGIDLEQRPDWAAECEATLDLLEDIELGQRAFWLAVPLSNSGWDTLAGPLGAAMTEIKDHLGAPRTVPERQIENRLRQAELTFKAIPKLFYPRPSTVAETVWIYQHAMQRGLGLDSEMDLGTPTSPSPGMSSATALARPVLDPSGQSDLAGKAQNPIALLKRAFIKVINPETAAASYQAHAYIKDTPSGGVVFPGAEWIGRVDECGHNVDWAMRITVRGREEVKKRNRRAATNIADQAEQSSGDTANPSGSGSTTYDEIAIDLSDYERILDTDKLEVETDTTTIFVVSAATVEDVQDATRNLTDFFKGSDFKLATDATLQEELWWAGLPGVLTTPTIRSISQVQTGHHLAGAVPIISSELGDDFGSMLALEITSGRPQPVLIDLDGSNSTLDVASAVAVSGELGSGKSVTEKVITLDAVDRGATLTAIDRTVMGEWGKAVAGVPGHRIVKVDADAEVSFDPLRIYGPDRGARLAQTFLSMLLNTQATSIEGVIVNDVLDANYLAQHKLTGLGDVVDHLATDCKMTGAAEVARKIHVFARQGICRAIFDQNLPALDLSAPVIVFWTAAIELPSTDELNSPHRFNQMPISKIFGRAAFALITAIARQKCFATRATFDIFAVDETHGITSSPEGVDELTLFIRDSRKHRAGLVLGSHDPLEDFGGEVLRRLIPFRIAMRHRDAGLAERSLRWLLGLQDGTSVDPELITMLSEHTSPIVDGAGVPLERRGECFIRDFRGRVGRAKILEPALGERATAIMTTPENIEAVA